MMSSFRKSMNRAWLTAAACVAVTVPQSAGAQLFLSQPNFAVGPIEGSDPMVGLPIPGATPAEYRAHLLWNLRAGLNVAALQCQFSAYLRAVDNYNGILAHHNKELAEAYTTLNNYFKRVQKDPKKGQKAFDDYTTITYNNFSTLQAQYGFCQTSSAIAREALLRPKGELYATAQGRMRELRGSLIPAYDQRLVYNPYDVARVALPPFQSDCWDRNGNLLPRCAAAYG